MAPPNVPGWQPYDAEQIEAMRALLPPSQEVPGRMLATIDALVVERDEALEAWRALLSDLESANGDWPGRCDAPRCRRLATCNDGDQIACDEHQGMLVAGDIEDLSYAAPLRRLRELLEKGQG